LSKFVKQLGLEETLKLDVVSATITYIGTAPPGTLTSVGIWKIKRLTTAADGDIGIEWADFGRNTQIWDNRAGLSYS